MVVYGPHIFGYYVFPIKKAKLVFIFEKPFLESGLQSPLIFVLF